jgi:hypothetical protein
MQANITLAPGRSTTAAVHIAARVDARVSPIAVLAATVPVAGPRHSSHQCMLGRPIGRSSSYPCFPSPTCPRLLSKAMSMANSIPETTNGL